MGMIYAKAYFLSYFVDKVTLVEFSKAVDTQTFFDNPLQIEALHSALCSTAGRNVFLDLRNNFVSIKLGIEKQLFPKENCLCLNNLLSMVWQTQADIKSKKITSQRERPDDTFDAKKKMRSDVHKRANNKMYTGHGCKSSITNKHFSRHCRVCCPDWLTSMSRAEIKEWKKINIIS